MAGAATGGGGGDGVEESPPHAPRASVRLNAYRRVPENPRRIVKLSMMIFLDAEFCRYQSGFGSTLNASRSANPQRSRIILK
jgi:hypothetical protein